MQDLLELGIRASIDAGKEILKIYQKDFEVETKEDDSPLTIADKKSNAVIQSFLKTTDIPILSEEGRNIPFNERKNWKKFWLLDPLDGTKEFVKRNDEFTVNIALIEKNEPIMGIIYVPVLDELYFAESNLGSYKLENVHKNLQASIDIEVIKKNAKKLPLNISKSNYTILASRSHMSSETEDYIGKLKKEHKHIDLISRGSSLKICMVAEGKADVYPRFAPTSEWDTAAGQAIAVFSGARVTRIDEIEPLTYNKKDLLNPWFIVKR